MTVQNGADNATFINCILTEALTIPGIPRGRIRKGSTTLRTTRDKAGSRLHL